MTRKKLLPVTDQHLLAGPADPGAILLQARQHDLVAVIHVSPAKTGHIPRAGVTPLLLRRSARGHQQKRNDEEKSGHFYASHSLINTIKSGSARALKQMPGYFQKQEAVAGRRVVIVAQDEEMFVPVLVGRRRREERQEQADERLAAARTELAPQRDLPAVVIALRQLLRSGIDHDRQRNVSRRRLGGTLRGGAMRAAFQIGVDTETRGRFIRDVRRKTRRPRRTADRYPADILSFCNRCSASRTRPPR
jgi:hypothetical protein